VALLKARGDIAGAVQELNNFVARFQADESAWHQLADLHLLSGNFAAAVFCFEELLLFNPYSHVLHTRLAEAYYSMGGAPNLLAARRHFAQSLDLKGRANARASLGLCMCTHALAATNSLSEAETSMNVQLFTTASERVRNDHSSADSNLRECLQHVLQGQASVVGTTN